MKLIIETQVYENYGAHDWDGTGECPQSWRAKGGSSYHVEGVSLAVAQDPEKVRRLLDKANAKVHHDNHACREYMIDWHLEEDDYLSWFESSQLEYDGKITYPDERLVL